VRAQRSVGFGVRAGRLLSLEIGNTGEESRIELDLLILLHGL